MKREQFYLSTIDTQATDLARDLGPWLGYFHIHNNSGKPTGTTHCSGAVSRWSRS